MSELRRVKTTYGELRRVKTCFLWSALWSKGFYGPLYGPYGPRFSKTKEFVMKSITFLWSKVKVLIVPRAYFFMVQKHTSLDVPLGPIKAGKWEFTKE